MLRIAFSSCALWLGSVRSVDALLLSMAGHTFALQVGDILRLGSSHHLEFREYVLHLAEVESKAMLSQQPDSVRGR